MPSAKVTSVSPEKDTSLCQSMNPDAVLKFVAENYDAASTKWYHDGVEQTAYAGKDTLRVLSNDFDNAGWYRFEVLSAGTCNLWITDSVEVSIVHDAPKMKSFMSDAIICAGDTLDLVMSATNFYRNRWYRNDTLLVEESKDTVLRVTEAGTYKVVTYNGCGEDSSEMKLTVFARAEVVAAPDSAPFFCEDRDSILLVAGVKGDNLTREWYFDVAPSSGDFTLLPQFTTDTLRWTASLAHEGDYRFIVSNVCSVDTERVATVGITRKLSVTTSLTMEVVCCEGESLGVTDGDMKFVVDNATKYVWEKDSAGIRVLLPDTTAQFKRAYLLPNDSGRYYVTASNRCFELRDTVHITVIPLAKVTLNPVKYTTVYVGNSIRLVAASCNAISRQWYFNDRPMAKDTTNIAASIKVRGTKGDTLQINFAYGLKHSGRYTYVVKNACGITDTSDLAEVVVVDTSKLNVKVEKIALSLKGDTITRVAIDSIVTFKICVTNYGSIFAHGITAVDRLHEGFELVGIDTLLLHIDNKTLNLKISDTLHSQYMNGSNVVHFTYRARAIKPGTYQNQIYSHCYSGEEVHKDSSQHSIAIFAEKDLAITKEFIKVENNPVFDYDITFGDLVTYRVTVKNVGMGSITNIRVNDFLPVSSVMYYSNWMHLGMNETVSDSLLSVDATGITLNGGQTFEFEVTVKMVEEGYQTLSADVTSGDYETDTTNNHADMKVYVRGLRIPPMVITPNDDGINDFFEIYVGRTYPNNELFVYNCKGDLVYRKKNYYKQLKGNELPSGTYIFAFRFVDEYGKTHQLNGSMVVKSYIELDEIISEKYDTMHIYDTTYIYDLTCPEDSSINTAVTLVEQSSIKLYPNPTSGYLIVESEELSVGEVVNVYSLSGALMTTYQIAGKKTSINVAHLPSGTYLLRVGKQTARFVKH